MAFWKVFSKDVRLELRTKESLSTMVVFAAAVILLFSFAFDANPARFRDFIPGFLWLTYFFVAALGLLRSFGHEKDLEAYSLLLSAPIDRSAIYLGKTAAFVVFLLIAQLISLPLFGLFLDVPLLTAPLALVLIIILSDVAIAAVGNVIAGMSVRSPSGETMLPILLFPLLTPLLIAASKATDSALSGEAVIEYDKWLMLLATYAGVFLIAGTLIFDYISEQ